MNIPTIVRRSLVAAVLSAPILGCGGASSPDNGAVGPTMSPEQAQEASKKVLESRGTMKPAGLPKK